MDRHEPEETYAANAPVGEASSLRPATGGAAPPLPDQLQWAGPQGRGDQRTEARDAFKRGAKAALFGETREMAGGGYKSHCFLREDLTEILLNLFEADQSQSDSW